MRSSPNNSPASTPCWLKTVAPATRLRSSFPPISKPSRPIVYGATATLASARSSPLCGCPPMRRKSRRISSISPASGSSRPRGSNCRCGSRRRENLFRALQVGGDLSCELLARRELFFRANPLDEFELDLLPIEVAVEVEDVGLEAALRLGESRPHPDIRDRRISAVGQHDARCIDTIGRQALGARLHVGRRKADRASALASMHHRTAEEVIPSEHRGGPPQFARANRLAHAGGTHLGVAESDWPDNYRFEAQFPPERLHHRGVARAIMPKADVVADHDRTHADTLAQV